MKMASSLFTVGELVKCQKRTCLITQIVNRPGFNRYHVTDLELCYKLKRCEEIAAALLPEVFVADVKVEDEADIQDYPVDVLNAKLRTFYAELQNGKGESYSKSSLVNIRAGLNRHLTSPPFNRAWDLMHDREFQGSNQVFYGNMRTLRQADWTETSTKTLSQRMTWERCTPVACSA